VEAARNRRIRLVLVDDDDSFVESVTALLASDPRIEVVATASSGEEAIDLVRRTRPDCVAMDVSMPGIGGIEAARSIRATNPGTHVVLVSGSIFAAGCPPGAESAASAFTTKARVAVDLPATVLRLCAAPAG
jgi:DNA-binding NarL/FixJ family response regulator